MNIDNKFVKEYDGLISDRLRKAGLYGDAFDTIKSKIYERILASNSYDPERGKVSTWLWQICRSVISNEVKKNSRSQDILDDHPLSLDEANSVIGAEDAGTTQDELDRIFNVAIHVSGRDKQIVKDYYLENFSMREVAKRHNMETRSVEQVIYRTMKALRLTAEDEE